MTAREVSRALKSSKVTHLELPGVPISNEGPTHPQPEPSTNSPRGRDRPPSLPLSTLEPHSSTSCYAGVVGYQCFPNNMDVDGT